MVNDDQRESERQFVFSSCLDCFPVRRMVLPMPVEVEDLPIEVAGTIEFQADLVCLLLPVREGESGLSSSLINIWAKLHFAAVFNDGIGAGG